MTDSALEDLAPPESWEAADLDAAVSRLMLASSPSTDAVRQEELPEPPPPSHILSSACSSVDKVPGDAIDQVDQFLREALQNPRERLSVLRLEQDVEKFVRDPTQQQMEFRQLPTSYLRLAAHRVAQHYSLQSMVLVDNCLPDGSGSRITVRKTSESKLPAIRLADIPVNLQSEVSCVFKVAIKQRPQKQSSVVSGLCSNSVKTNNSKSVEERKEEYNRARARIFNSSSSSSGPVGRPENEHRLNSLGSSRMEDKAAPSLSDMNSSRVLSDSSTSSSRITRSRTEKEPAIKSKHNNRVAIFRDRETERRDPDYDRSYDRYSQRFDPGFGFNNGPYTVQPMFTPALNYNTEFPQLGSTHRPQVHVEHQPRPLPQHLPAPWGRPSNPAGIAYGHPETMVPPFGPGQIDANPTSAVYLHSSPFPCQRPRMPFIHPHEQVHLPFAQSHQPQCDGSFGLGRPR